MLPKTIPFPSAMSPRRRKKGATLISVDPRFTRTSSKADIYAPMRSGTDIAFIGGMINFILENDLIHRDYVRLYTNGPFIVNQAFKMPGETDHCLLYHILPGYLKTPRPRWTNTAILGTRLDR